MGVRKFDYKFIDNDAKKCTKMVVVVCSLNQYKWDHDDDVDGYVKWMDLSTKWEFKVGDKVDKEVKDKLKLDFNDYKIIKKKYKDAFTIVNVNPDKKSKDIIFKGVCCEKCCSTKLAKGETPDPWQKIFDYDEEIIVCNYLLKGNEFTETVELKEVTIPFHMVPEETIYLKKGDLKNPERLKELKEGKAKQEQKSDVVAPGQTGGDYDNGDYEQDYRKYKRKYLSLKKQLGFM